MAQDTDHDRISRKAHELWESEGRPHGRDQVHWDEAKEIVALEDSLDETLLPRDTGAGEPEEPPLAVTNQGEMPNLTDQGANDLTSTDREPENTKPAAARPAQASPVGNGAPVAVTGKASPKPSDQPASVTKGKAGGKA